MNIRKQVTAAAVTGLSAGLILGLLAVRPTIPSFTSLLFDSTEIILTVLRKLFAPAVARAFASDAGLLILYGGGGLVYGAMAGIVLGLAERLFKRELNWAAAFRLAFSFLFGSIVFGYMALWYMGVVLGEFKELLEPMSILWILAIIGTGVLSGVLAFMVLAVLQKPLRKLGRVPTKLIISIPASAIGLMILLVFLPNVGTSSDDFSAHASSKVLLIGLDGLSWDVVHTLIDEGKLPNIKKLMEEGVYGDLRSMRPSRSPSIWTSIATGKTPDRHGILDFIRRVPGTAETIPETSNSRKVRAIWNILGDGGYRVGIVNWYVTWPPEKVNGYMVSDRLLYKEVAGRSYPDTLDREVDAVMADAKSKGTDWNRFTFFRKHSPEYSARFQLDQDLAAIEKIVKVGYERDLVLEELSEKLLHEGPPDLFAVYFRTTDGIQHFFWKYFMAKESPSLSRVFFSIDKERYNDLVGLIPEYYQFMDEMIGKLVSCYDERPTILLASDHGFGLSLRRSNWVFNPNFIYEKLGWLAYKPDGNIDMSKTRVFDAGNYSWNIQRASFINLKGREQEGIVKSGKEFDSLLETVRSTLSSLKTDNGIPVFEKIEVSAGSGSAGGGDFRVTLNRKIWGHEVEINGQSVPVTDFAIAANNSGIHRMNGVFIASGCGFKRGERIYGASVLDVTPTLLYYLGLPAANDMDGKVLTQAMSPEFVKAKPPKYIDTYEMAAQEGKAAPLQSPADEEIKEKLRALGYIK